MARPQSAETTRVAAVLVLLGTVGACQAIAGLSSLEVDAEGSGGASSSGSAASGVTATGTSSSVAATTTGSTTGSTSTGGGEGGEGATASSAGGDGGGGTTTTGNGGRGGEGGEGGDGGRGATTTTGDGGGGNGGTGGDGGGGGATTGGCEDSCPPLDVCYQTCFVDGSCTGDSCKACGAAPPPPNTDNCPPFCADCDAFQSCIFDCADTMAPCGPELRLNTGIMTMELHCNDQTACAGKLARCDDPGPPGAPDDQPTSGPYACKLDCEVPGACVASTIDCRNHPGDCLVVCLVPEACTNLTVQCGPAQCVVVGGDLSVTVHRNDACSVIADDASQVP